MKYLFLLICLISLSNYTFADNQSSELNDIPSWKKEVYLEQCMNEDLSAIIGEKDSQKNYCQKYMVSFFKKQVSNQL